MPFQFCTYSNFIQFIKAILRYVACFIRIIIRNDIKSKEASEWDSYTNNAD